MKAGSELDKLVAEKVMGWKFDWQPFQPSTNISDAWLVVDKLESQKWMYNIGNYNNGEKFCTFYGEFTVSGLAWEEPLAICLAALKSVGVDID